MDSSNLDYSNFTLDEWIEYTQLQHARSIDMSLDRIRQVWKNLSGEKPPLVITVAGTNGKGSSVSMLSAVLREAGLKVGSFTSPHLIRYNERIAINGEYATDKEICQAFCEIESMRGNVTLTYFEYSTLNALLIFKANHVEAAVLEVGMGGRLDSVNLIDNDVAVITSIGLDHMQWLGNNIEQIGAEKAGIFRANGFAVFADLQAPMSVSRIAVEKQTTLLQNGSDFNLSASLEGVLNWHSDNTLFSKKWRHIHNIRQPFYGEHQKKNLAGVIAALALVADRYDISPEHLHEGLKKSSLVGRCQILQHYPEMILDVAHNAAAVQELSAFLLSREPKRTVAIFGALQDKDVIDILAQIKDKIDVWYLASLPGERGQTAEALRDKMYSNNIKTNILCFDTAIEAYQQAVKDISLDDRLLIFGSFYIAGDILKLHVNNT